ncbi:MAG: hypothetical protein H7172_12745 [Ferruginibacter sp.]|nr:hypothetical protein [Rhodoferax sp.]
MLVTPVPAVLDIEASGFGRLSYPIEVGCILPDGTSFCSLIRPEPEWVHWDPKAEKLHHISRELTVKVGRSALDVARLLNIHLRGQTVYSDGWANDFTWVAALFEAVDMSPYFKLENLRSLLSEDEAARWHDVKQQVSDELGLQRHRASSDARVLQRTLQRLMEARV